VPLRVLVSVLVSLALLPGDPPASDPLAEYALAESLGDERAVRSWARQLAALAVASEDYAQAQSWLERVEQAAWSRADLSAVAEARLARAEVALCAGDLGGARTFIDATSGGWEVFIGSEQRLEGLTLRARIAQREQSTPECAAYLREALLLASGGKSPDSAVRRTLRIGIVAAELGELQVAGDAHLAAERALARVEDDGLRAESLALRGHVEQRRGLYPAALRTYEDALEFSRDPALQVSILGALAALKETRGEFEGALEDLRASRSLAARHGSTENAAKYATLEANLHLKRGRALAAVEAAHEALRLLGANAPASRRVEPLIALAAACVQAGDDAALAEATHRLEGAARTSASDFDLASAEFYLAMITPDDDPGAALEHGERSLLHARAAASPELEANALGVMSWYRQKLGDHVEAIREAWISVDLYSDLRMEASAIDVLDTVASSAKASGNVVEMDRCVAEAARRLESSMLGATAAVLPTDLELAFGRFEAHAQDLVALRIGAKFDAENAVRAGFRRAGLFRARSLMMSMLGRGAARSAASSLAEDEELESARQEWDSVLADLTSIRGIELRARSEIAERLLAARRRHAEAVERRVERTRRDLREHDPFRTSAEDARRILPNETTALVVYAEGSERLYAYVIRGREPRFLDLGPLAEIQSSARRVAREISGDGQPEPCFASRRELDRACQDLYDSIVRPVLEAAGPTVDSLAIVPSPALFGVSFDALVVGYEPTAANATQADGRPIYLVERVATSFLPSVPTGIQLTKQVRKPSGYRPALVLGDPDFGRADTALAARSNTLPLSRLPGARGEAVDVASRLEDAPDARRDPAASDAFDRIRRMKGDNPDGPWKSPRVELLVGTEATRDAFVERAPAVELIHVATHGSLVEGDWARTGLAFASVGSGSSFLSVSDILDLDLRARLAVLAACDTGASDGLSAEGPTSMAWAFLHAGSKSVVASLWKPDDEAARQVLVSFYDGILDRRLGPQVALREAKLALLRSGDRGIAGVAGPALEDGSPRTHPRRWAPFVYFGVPE